MTINDVELAEETGERTSAGNSYEQTYRVYFSGGYSTAALLANTHADLPHLGDDGTTLVGDYTVYVQSIKPALESGSRPDEGVATYTVSWGVPAIDVFRRDLHPLDRPAVWQGAGGIGINEVVYQTTDATPVAITNSVGDLYNPLPERPKRGSRITITVTTDTYPASIAYLYSNTVNSDVVLGTAAGLLYMEEITWSSKSEVWEGEQVDYYEVTYPIRYCPDGWRAMIVDNGHAVDVEWDTGTTTRMAVTDAMGFASATPVLLDGNGGVLASGAAPVVYPTAGYRIIHEVAWAGLSLPTPPGVV